MAEWEGRDSDVRGLTGGQLPHEGVYGSLLWSGMPVVRALAA